MVPARCSAAALRLAITVVMLLAMSVVAAPGAVAAATFTVVSTSDNGDENIGDGICQDVGESGCTLRAALEEANADAGKQTIVFDLPAAGGLIISPMTPLPSIADPVVIDGTTQPGGVPLIRAGNPNVATGLVVLATVQGARLRGLQVQGFETVGISVDGDDNLVAGNAVVGNPVGVSVGGARNTLLGNYLGTLDGATATGNGYGVELLGDDNVVGGAVGGSANVISGNNQGGVLVSTGTSGNVITGNVIGATANGQRALPNVAAGVAVVGAAATIGPDNLISGNGGPGVRVRPPPSGAGPPANSATGTVIEGNDIGTDSSGGFALANGGGGVLLDDAGNNTVQGNLISGNLSSGVIISGPGASANDVVGNLIGTDAAGGAGVGNFGGVYIDGAPGNTIGGSAVGSANVISGNIGDGVTFINDGASGNALLGNRIGTDPAGMSAIPNSGYGVFVDAPNDVVGAAGAGNLISGNGRHGVWVAGGANAVIQANYIGTDATGGQELGNSADGVLVSDSAGNLLGGTAPGTGNIVSGNGAHGVEITSVVAGDADGNRVLGNLVGTKAGGAAALGNGGDGVHIDGATNTVVGGTTAAARNVISGNAADGLRVLGAAATNTKIRGNYVGTDAAGTSALGNAANGLEVSGGAAATTIGGTVAGAGNVISANFNGVVLGVGTSGSLVQGNRIGTDAAGNAALGNTLEGVKIDHATANTLGGATAAAGNVISGNTDGVRISGDGITTTMDNSVLHNYIGTDAAGTAGVGNAGNGIFLDNARGNVIGRPGAGNVVSANADYGIRVLDTNSTANLIQANDIGTDATGTAALGNGLDGVFVDNAPSNTIGGTATGAGNVISANGGNGIQLARAAAGHNVVQGNRIGTQAGGDVALGNSLAGVLITRGAHGETIGPGNRIGFNGKQGVLVASGIRTRLSRNAIFGNTALGIDLGPIGVTANDPGDADPGPNGLQNYPLLATATVGSGTITVSGTLNSHADTTYELQFFAQSACDPSGSGEGQRYLGSTTVTTDAGGNATFTAPFARTVPAGQSVTATAIDPVGDTSEFSACRTTS